LYSRPDCECRSSLYVRFIPNSNISSQRPWRIRSCL
jgi:hypothetical protein